MDREPTGRPERQLGLVWSADEPFQQVDRFIWERAARDPKVGMPRELLGFALLFATYSTGRTGRDIDVSQETLREVLGYEDDRYVRRLLAELRDGYGLVRCVRRGNRHQPSGHELVIPNDLLERAEKVRAKRERERSRESKQAKGRRSSGSGAPGKDGYSGSGAPCEKPVDNPFSTGSGAPCETDGDGMTTDLFRAHSASIQGAQRFYSGRTRPHDQEGTYGPYQDLSDQAETAPPYGAEVEATPAPVENAERQVSYAGPIERAAAKAATAARQVAEARAIRHATEAGAP